MMLYESFCQSNRQKVDVIILSIFANESDFGKLPVKRTFGYASVSFFIRPLSERYSVSLQDCEQNVTQNFTFSIFMPL